MPKHKPKYKIDEINVLQNHLEFLGHVCQEEAYEDEKEERKIKEDIKKIKERIKEIKTKGETHRDLKWRVQILSEILDFEESAEILPFEGNMEACKEGKKIQKEYLKA